ncbi:RimK/LysX family protein [Halomonas sp. McH1-25]|uniref:ATP-dependent zinc protease family protein n=1 Tax=unclassified Halomonas TaxID=2609666 RepID=UPI001EF697D4|nr:MULTISPECIES: RimK/LysX family protein [unclassified Halomonas]MCG7600311.1 RimK/LysX family protein [Halomonas sp. McH1-25]MCP1342487.1 RimK/LysX family protein [Halomonas sp. FL8]MCP1359576.1 RimK/LysX family protein [Halomonas sp. BBD45]MCP1364457.1 RimK/LysX family protein [Halomonas sp. BBD48]
MKALPYQAKAVIGRREMVTLPELGLTLCCKADTGARTSALHAEEIETYEEDDHVWVSFVTRGGGPSSPAHPVRLHLHDRRKVTSSNGQAQWRFVIRTNLQLGELAFPVELTLADRSNLRHPMLLGRRAMRRLLVAPGAAFLHGEP